MKRTGSVLLLSLMLGGCGANHTNELPGQLIVALTSEMPVPKDITSIDLQVLGSRDQDFDTLTWSNPVTFAGASQGNLSSGSQALPATLALTTGKDPSRPVKVTARAWQGEGPSKRLRISTTRVTTPPATGSAVLSIPMEWLCDADAQPTSADVDTQCTDPETCIAGECTSNFVDPSTLGSYTEWSSGQQPGAACFDALQCFATSSVVSIVDSTQCLIDAPQGALGVNIAMLLPGDAAGTCSGSKCWVVLDYGSLGGWAQAGVASDKIQLPRRVCELLVARKVTGVSVTTACATKTESLPLCGQ